jgi:predicted dehydrogenase
MDKVRFGVIGLGTMGREFASCVARWSDLTDATLAPVITAICSAHLPPETEAWFRRTVGTIKLATREYRELLASGDVDAIYIAVPHDLHEQMYVDTLNAGKHLMGEKPFGIDKRANAAITEALHKTRAERVGRKQPDLLVRCASQFIFIPGAQRIAAMLEAGAFGTIIEAEVGFLHSSDLNPRKPINWKRRAETNGEYGVMGDLGMHALALPFRAGWLPQNVRAILSKVIAERPAAAGSADMVSCDTWDNATLLCETIDSPSGDRFPFTVRTHRIAPGERNSWYIRIYGTNASALFSTKEINTFWLMEYEAGGEQAWQRIDLGSDTPFPTIAPGTFEFGFVDAILQMWGAYLYELEHGRPRSTYTGCVTPEEAALSHSLFSAALESQKRGKTVTVC